MVLTGAGCSDDLLYGNSQGVLRAYDAGGAKCGGTGFPDALYTRSARDGLVIIGTASGRDMGFDARTGRRRWHLF